jgi:glycosyltransferase involved in cell wall biosynthesis
MISLSVVIIAFNEEKDIGRCLESVKGLADEILVLDSFSTDATEKICRTFGVRFEQHAFDGYVNQKNRAMRMARNDHILSLDADEALSPELQEEIKGILNNWDRDGYSFNRRNSYCGHWMRHTTWYPDRKLRLFVRTKAEWSGADPHDFIRMEPGSRVRHLHGDLLHWPVHTREEQTAKVEHFARVSANHHFQKGKRARRGSALIHSGWRWFREYVIRFGFLDGKAGWQVSSSAALYVWRKYYYLRQLYESQ